MKTLLLMTLTVLVPLGLATVDDPCIISAVNGTCLQAPSGAEATECCTSISATPPSTAMEPTTFSTSTTLAPAKVPPTPAFVAQASCPSVRVKPVRFFPDDAIFSRQGTKQVANYYKNVNNVLDLCLLANLFPGGQAVGLSCGLAHIDTSFVAQHANECIKKNQCLKLKAYTVPFCIGNKDGCCG